VENEEGGIPRHGNKTSKGRNAEEKGR